MPMVSSEEMELLMQVAGSEDPVMAAIQERREWLYVLGLARAAQLGLRLDDSLPQVILDCDLYAVRAERMITILSDWIYGHPRA